MGLGVWLCEVWDQGWGGEGGGRGLCGWVIFVGRWACGGIWGGVGGGFTCCSIDAGSILAETLHFLPTQAIYTLCFLDKYYRTK